MTEETILSPKTTRLGRLRLRDTRGAKAQSASYSRAVDVLRWLLPVLVLIGLGVLLVWPMWQENRMSAVMVENVPNLMVEKLNLTGTDIHGQSYALTAARALQAANTKNIVDLEQPKGEIALNGGAWLAGHADTGRLNQGTNQLWLSGNVELFHDGGYRFGSEEMNVDIANNTAHGSQPITIQGDFGTIEGAGFRLDEGGKTITIIGPAKAKLSLQPAKQSDKPNLNTSQSR